MKSYLSIEWKSIKPHRADKVNMSGLGVHDILVTGDPACFESTSTTYNLNVKYVLKPNKSNWI